MRYREAEGQSAGRAGSLADRPSSISATREVRAPVAGRVGRLEITVGNLVAAGPGAPVLTTLVSVDPIYASFNADEQIVARALQGARRQMRHATWTASRSDGDRNERWRLFARPAAAHRQQVDAQERHRARARGVRQSRRRA